MIGPVVQDTIPEPCDIFGQLFSFLAQLRFHIVDQRMRQHLGSFDDHFVRVVVAVVTGLRKYRDRFVTHLAPVFVCDDLAHLPFCGLGHGIQKGLRHTVTDSRMQPLAFHLDGFHHGGQFAEIVRFFAGKLGFDISIDDGDEVFCQEKGISSTGAGRTAAQSPKAIGSLPARS